jgi:hypothetical protein
MSGFLTTAFGILSVPLTAALFVAVAIGTLWAMHFASYLSWLIP